MTFFFTPIRNYSSLGIIDPLYNMQYLQKEEDKIRTKKSVFFSIGEIAQSYYYAGILYTSNSISLMLDDIKIFYSKHSS